MVFCCCLKGRFVLRVRIFISCWFFVVYGWVLVVFFRLCGFFLVCWCWIMLLWVCCLVRVVGRLSWCWCVNRCVSVWILLVWVLLLISVLIYLVVWVVSGWSWLRCW